MTPSPSVENAAPLRVVPAPEPEPEPAPEPKKKPKINLDSLPIDFDDYDPD